MPIPSQSHEDLRPRQLVRDRVYTEIRDAILTGVLLPGERLEEAGLREWLGVSSTPIRQALQTLAVEGFVETAPQSYTAVTTPHPEQARENLQTIGVLLSGMSILTLPALDAGQLARLATLAGAAAVRNRPGDGRTAVEAYFGALFELCPNTVLTRLAMQAGMSLAYQLTVAHHALDAELSGLSDGFRALQEALAANDVETAEAATRRIFLLP